MRTARVFAIALSLCLAATAYGWGPRGHQISAALAEQHLTEEASNQVADLLDGESMADVANWADQIRNDRPDTKEWHFVDIDVRNATYLESRDCPSTPNSEVKRNCVIGAINHFQQVLADQNASRADRVEALKFLIHFIPDMHQPLHAAEKNNDAGGNKVTVNFFGKKTKLHGLWDSGLISRAKIPNNDDYVDHLIEHFEESDDGSIADGTVVDWANEAHGLAISNVYRIPKSKNLGATYLERNLPVVDDQLVRGALRLARVLNDSLQ